MTIGGAVSEQGTIQTGVASAELAFTPQQITTVLSNHLLLLGLDDPRATPGFRDISGNGYDGTCATPTTCPTTGAPGRFGDSVQFAGAATQAIKIAAMNVPRGRADDGAMVQDDVRRLRLALCEDDRREQTVKFI